MELLTYGTLVCVSFFPPQAKFFKCDEWPTIKKLYCYDDRSIKCERAEYELRYTGCAEGAYFPEPIVSAKDVAPVVLWQEYEESPGVYVKKPVCPDFKRIQK